MADAAVGGVMLAKVACAKRKQTRFMERGKHVWGRIEMRVVFFWGGEGMPTKGYHDL